MPAGTARWLLAYLSNGAWQITNMARTAGGCGGRLIRHNSISSIMTSCCACRDCKVAASIPEQWRLADHKCGTHRWRLHAVSHSSNADASLSQTVHDAACRDCKVAAGVPEQWSLADHKRGTHRRRLTQETEEIAKVLYAPAEMLSITHCQEGVTHTHTHTHSVSCNAVCRDCQMAAGVPQQWRLADHQRSTHCWRLTQETEEIAKAYTHQLRCLASHTVRRGLHTHTASVAMLCAGTAGWLLVYLSNGAWQITNVARTAGG